MNCCLRLTSAIITSYTFLLNRRSSLFVPAMWSYPLVLMLCCSEPAAWFADWNDCCCWKKHVIISFATRVPFTMLVSSLLTQLFLVVFENLFHAFVVSGCLVVSFPYMLLLSVVLLCSIHYHSVFICLCYFFLSLCIFFLSFSTFIVQHM